MTNEDFKQIHVEALKRLALEYVEQRSELRNMPTELMAFENEARTNQAQKSFLLAAGTTAGSAVYKEYIKWAEGEHERTR